MARAGQQKAEVESPDDAFASIPQFSGLRRLTTGAELFALENSASTHALHLSGMRVTTEAARFIGRMRFLNTLVLDHCSLFGKQFHLLAKQCPGIESLSLFHSVVE